MIRQWNCWKVGEPYISIGPLAKGTLTGSRYQDMVVDLKVKKRDFAHLIPDGKEIVEICLPDLVLIKDQAETVDTSRKIAVYYTACYKDKEIGTRNPSGPYWQSEPWNVWEALWIEVPLSR
ncbi:MAG: hypothetical protein AAB486_01255 [Patescibacteria group bacterium]